MQFDDYELKRMISQNLRYRAAAINQSYDRHDFRRIDAQAIAIAAKIKRLHPNIAMLDHDGRVSIVVEAIQNEPMLPRTPAPKREPAFTANHADPRLSALRRIYRQG